MAWHPAEADTGAFVAQCPEEIHDLANERIVSIFPLKVFYTSGPEFRKPHLLLSRKQNEMKYSICLKILIKKAARYDCFPPKILKLAAEEFANSLTSMINDSIKSAKFPAQLKCAQWVFCRVSQKSMSGNIMTKCMNISWIFYHLTYLHLGKLWMSPRLD